jgi:F420-dependent oxidoreductase-like protein
LIRFGLQIVKFTYPGVPDEELFDRVADIALAAENSGFDSLFLMDHFYQIEVVGAPNEPILEAYSTLSALATRTKKIRLGVLVTGVTYRNPALLAKTVTTLDVISGGRAILGIGAAWNDDEHTGYGFEFPATSERLNRLEEAVQICKAMFSNESPSFDGRFYKIENALNNPRPIQRDGIPIMIGGGGEKRTLRLVAEHADISNFFGDLPTVRHKLAILDRHCEDVGRDPKEITRTRLGTLIVAPSQSEAKEKLDREARRYPFGEEAFRSDVIAGDPDTVAGTIRDYLDAGLDGLIFNLVDAHEISTVVLAGEAIRKAER